MVMAQHPVNNFLSSLLPFSSDPNPTLPDTETLDYLQSATETVEDADEFLELLGGFCDWLDVDQLGETGQFKDLYATFVRGLSSSEQASDPNPKIERTRLSELVRVVGATDVPLDDSVVDYLYGVMVDHLVDDNDAFAAAQSVLQLQDTCRGDFERKRAEWLASTQQQDSQPNANTQANSPKSSSSSQRRRARRAQRKASAGSEDDPIISKPVAQVPISPNVTMLLELCPSGSDPQVVQHIFAVICSCDMTQAAQWILDNGYERGIQEKKDHDRDVALRETRLAEETEAELKRQKDVIMARFDERLEYDSDPKKKIVGQGRQDLFAQKKKNTKDRNAKQIRYLDGKAMSMKGGQKFVTEAVKEEWDGGSRGRVKTKGKRGKGWA